MARTPGAQEALMDYLLCEDLHISPFELERAPARKVRRLHAIRTFLHVKRQEKPRPT